MRWVATMPLGDLLGDGKLDVIVTTPGGSGAPDRVIALQDTPGQSPPVRALWTYTSGLPSGETSFDQYSSALVDVAGDGKPDVIFTDKQGVLRVLTGANGQLLWSYPTNHYIESGSAVADLNGDGVLDLVLPMGCYGALKAYDGLSGNLEWVRQLGPRTQALPSIGDLDGDGKLEIVVASYDGNVYALQGGARLYLPAAIR